MGQRDLTQGSVAGHLAALTGPMTVGVLSVMSIAIADTYFLAQVGVAELTAISFIYPVSIALSSLGIGLSAGANSVISQSVGANDGEARRHASHAVMLGLSFALLVVVIALFAWEPLFRLMNASDQSIALIGDYIYLWLISFPALIMMMVLNAALRAHGDAVTPAAIMVLSAAMNIALNPWFIFGGGPMPALGMEGAALSTLVARSLAMCATFALALYGTRVLAIGAGLLSGCLSSVWRIARVGGVAAASNAINPMGLSIVTAIVAALGENYVAGFGAASRIQSLALVPLLALSGSIGPMIGQNWGANQYGRVRTSMGEAFGFCLAYGLAVAVVLAVFADGIAGLFAADNPAVRDAAALYLRVVGWSLFGYGMLVVANGAMNARERPLAPLAVGAARVFAIYAVLATLLVEPFGFPGILIAAVIANVLGAGGALAMTIWADLLAVPRRWSGRFAGVGGT